MASLCGGARVRSAALRRVHRAVHAAGPQSRPGALAGRERGRRRRGALVARARAGHHVRPLHARGLLPRQARAGLRSGGALGSLPPERGRIRGVLPVLGGMGAGDRSRLHPQGRGAPASAGLRGGGGDRLASERSPPRDVGACDANARGRRQCLPLLPVGRRGVGGLLRRRRRAGPPYPRGPRAGRLGARARVRRRAPRGRRRRRRRARPRPHAAAPLLRRSCRLAGHAAVVRGCAAALLPAALLPCCPAALVRGYGTCYPATLLLCCPATLLPCSSAQVCRWRSAS